ncbi:MAG: sulfatase [Actinomycetales bacterium]
MRAVILMFDSLNRHLLGPYGDTFVDAPNFARLAERTVTFDRFYAGSMPCMPARREMHTGRYNFLHRSWGPLEPFDDSMPELLKQNGVHTHLASDHPHYWEDGGATYHTRYSTWEFFRGQEGDPWKGVVDFPQAQAGMFGRMRRQDAINRTYMPTPAEHYQTRTVDAGLHFLTTNAAADNWLLQIELFDPHEPFFAHDDYRKRYQLDGVEPAFDWPPYAKVTQGQERTELARKEYAALVSMCDDSVGRVLDAMDEHDLWDDTMLIVNTDHGYLLGEHGWWAKGMMPWYDELVHLPFFVWDPRTRRAGERCQELAQTIDLAPTLLSFFGVEPTPDMQGHDLGPVVAGNPIDRSGALYGLHGGHVNVTDGSWTYMRSGPTQENSPLREYTLMPTHMRARFSVEELRGWEPAEPFSFSKGLRTMGLDAQAPFINPWQHGTLLFDLDADPGQLNPVVDDEVEVRMMELLVELMRASDAPPEQYLRLGLPLEGPVSVQHLLVATHARRAQQTAEALPGTEELQCLDILTLPLADALGDPERGAILRELLGDVTGTELLTMAPATSILDLAAAAQFSAHDLRELDTRLAVPATG